jgi:UDP-3-O-[3-hydroxymyristoyl] N-acetylglucosamine deacetylase
MRLLPAPANTGIVFVRVDQTPPVSIPAVSANVSSTTMSTDISLNGVTVKTIEHFMSALFGVGITNLFVELTSTEVPVMDGSASTFIFLLREAGIVEQNAARKFMRITRPVAVGGEGKWASLEPHRGFVVDYTIDFDHPAIGKSQRVVDFTKHSFASDIANARTFGFLKDLEYLRANNLGLGGSTSNAIILDEYSIINNEGLRHDDEFVRHKILDAVGDLYVSGYQILGKYTGFKAGHAINNTLLQAVFDQQAYEIITSESVQASEEKVDIFGKLFYT